MFLGVLELDVLLIGAVDSLKHKRAIIRPVIARLRRFEVSVTEGGDPDRHRRALIGVAVISGEHHHLVELLDRCERHVAAEPELELLAAFRRIVSTDELA